MSNLGSAAARWRVAASRSNVDPRIAYDDLRQWIEEARKLGEIKEVQNLSWQRDIGMVAEMALHDDNAACFIFEDVPGTTSRAAASWSISSAASART